MKIANTVQGNDAQSTNHVSDFLFMRNKEFSDATNLALSIGTSTLAAMPKALKKPLETFALERVKEDQAAVSESGSVCKKIAKCNNNDGNWMVHGSKYFTFHSKKHTRAQNSLPNNCDFQITVLSIFFFFFK